MARGRMLNRKVSRSRKVAELANDCGPWAVVFHHRLIANLDINGNCRADPWWLKSELHPRDGQVSPDDCDLFAVALVDKELAIRYEVDGMEYLHVPDFQNEQGQLRRDKEKPQVPDIKEGRAVDRKPPGGGRPAGRSQVEVEVEDKPSDLPFASLTTDPAPSADSENPKPNGATKPGTLHQQAMPVLRKLGYEAGKHDGSILKAMVKKGVRWEKLEPAVRGLAAMRDDGGLRDLMGVAPGEELSLRILYARDGPKDGARPIWGVAEDRWYEKLAAEHRNERKKMPRLAV